MKASDETSRGAIARLAAWVAAHSWARTGLRFSALAVLIGAISLLGRRARSAGAPTPPEAAAPAASAPSALDAGACAARVPVAPLRDTPPNARAEGAVSPDSPVILNTATEAELRQLPSIGAKRAAAILALRQKLGKFRNVEDLLRVRGIGRATLKRLRPLVRIDPPPSSSERL